MDGFLQLYRTYARAFAAALHVKRAAPSPFGGALSALGDRLDHSIADGSAATAVGNTLQGAVSQVGQAATALPGQIAGAAKSLGSGLQSVGSGILHTNWPHAIGTGAAALGRSFADGSAEKGIWNFGKQQVRELTYGPYQDLSAHYNLARQAWNQGDYRGAIGQGVNAGLDGAEGVMNASLLAMAAPSGGTDLSLVPAKEGLMYGLRRMVGGGLKTMTPGLMAGSPRAALTDAARNLAVPAIDRMAGPTAASVASRVGGVANRALDGASSFLNNSQNPAIKFLSGRDLLPHVAVQAGSYAGANYLQPTDPMWQRAMGDYARTRSVDNLRQNLALNPQSAAQLAQQFDRLMAGSSGSSVVAPPS